MTVISSLEGFSADLRTSTYGNQPYGFWVTQGGNVLVEVKRCITTEGTLCADIRWTEDRTANLHLIGKRVLLDFKYKHGAWREGRVYDRASGKVYHADIRLNGHDELILNACALSKCYKQKWLRADQSLVQDVQQFASNE
jgi:uncharacterized protein (DUF2147 family)